jgi:hypothetical protein
LFAGRCLQNDVGQRIHPHSFSVVLEPLAREEVMELLPFVLSGGGSLPLRRSPPAALPPTVALNRPAGASCTSTPVTAWQTAIVLRQKLGLPAHAAALQVDESELPAQVWILLTNTEQLPDKHDLLPVREHSDPAGNCAAQMLSPQ